jgi:GMP synthase-like glutamine amidotransferase
VVTNYPTVKVFGGCFGSQVLALAMGGRVGKNPGGKFVVGSEELVLTDWLQSRSDFVYAVVRIHPVQCVVYV